MNSSRKGVVLITKSYPYDSGEEFLETEIIYLTQVFDDVIVIPSLVTPLSIQTRSTPIGVRVITPSERTIRGKGGHDGIRFLITNPIQAGRSIGAAVSGFPNRQHMKANGEYALGAALKSTAVYPQLTTMLRPELDYVTYCYWFDVVCGIGVDLKRKLDLPVVSRGHGHDIYKSLSTTKYLPLRDYFMRNIDSLHIVSEHGAALVRAEYPSHAEKIVVSRLGVTNAVNAGNCSQSSATIVSCSYVLPVKRLSLLVRSLAEVQNLGIDLNWVHIGGGPGDALDKLKRLASKQLVSGTFEFTGQLSNEAVRRWYAEHPSTAFINVSASEGVPVAAMEALAQGLPIIATNVGGNSELLSPETGMFPGLLPADPNASQVADLICQLLAMNNEDYRAASNASIDHWNRNWNAKHNYEAFAQVLVNASTN